MAARSWMFVPGDSEDKLGKVAGMGADVVIVDLEDAVALPEKTRARGHAREWLDLFSQHVTVKQGFARWVRINALDTALWEEDLAAVMAARPDGLVIPKVTEPEQLQTLAAELYELEQRNGIAPGTTRMLPMLGETAGSALRIGDFLTLPLPRLAGFSWGAEDLARALGAKRKRDDAGRWTDAFRMVRAQILMAAHARGVLAIDTLHADFRDEDGLAAQAEEAAADGFDGMLAIHPAQVGTINTAFTPAQTELAEARAIVAAFEAEPQIGAIQREGRMLDRSHLLAARNLLSRHV